MLTSLQYDPIGIDEDRCKQSMVCNWMNCTDLGLTAKECKEACTSKDESEFFCGLCENGIECIEFPEITSEKECRKKVACVSDHKAKATSKVRLCRWPFDFRWLIVLCRRRNAPKGNTAMLPAMRWTMRRVW
jgi:hypothetical protein